MRRVVATLSVAAVFAGAGSIPSAQVPANKDPHHKVLVYNIDLRLLEVILPAGQTTLEHMHEHDLAVVPLTASATRSRASNGDWGALVSSRPAEVSLAQHTGTAIAYRLENTDSRAYRMIEVENLREEAWPPLMPLTAPATSLLKENRAFNVYEVILSAAAPMTHHDHTRPAVIILLEGAIDFSGVGGQDPIPMRQPGQWILLSRFQPHDLTANGAGGRIVEIEVR
jgi:hypothetical protein